MAKFFAYSLAPKILMKAMQMGAFGAPLAVFYMGVKQWDLANYIVVPLGTTSDGRSVYLRIPQDESARFLSSMWWHMSGHVLDDEDKVGEKEPWTALLGYVAGNAPQKAPWMELIGQIINWTNGKTPMDDWSGKKAVPPVIDMLQGDMSDIKNREILKWFINSYTGQGFYKFKTYEDEMKGITNELEGILGFPIAGSILSRFIKIGTHGAEPKLYSASTAYDAYQAKITYHASYGLNKLMSGKAHEVTKQEIEALAIRFPSWSSNANMMESLTKVMGGNVILQRIVGEHDMKKRIYLISELVKWARKVGVDIPVEINEKE